VAGDHAGTELQALAERAQFEGDFERAIKLSERAFAAFRGAGDAERASAIARWLAFQHGTFHGNMAVATGWLARAETVLEGLGECAAHGWLTLFRAPFTEDPGERERFAATALAIAQRFGDTDLEFDALALLGETYVRTGRVAEGFRMIDEAMVAVTVGEVSAYNAVADIYCRLLTACELAIDVRRASEWIAAMDRHVVWTDFVRPTCRTHYGGILTALGRWAEAEVELVAAAEAFARGYRGDRVYALVRLADLRMRQGRIEEAERLIEGVEWHPIARRAGAAIALVRGETALAEELAGLCLHGAAPNDPACVAALDLLVTIQLARGDCVTARGTAERLAELAAACGLERVRAIADLASGRVAVAEGDGRARATLQRAFETFGALGLPLEMARAQLDLARALESTSPEAAVREGKVALGVFERLGAARDADAAGEFLRSLGAPGRTWPRSPGGLTKREREVLALLSAGASNAQIAERLVISRRTAEHHVASVLSKLDLRSRAEAAAYAVRMGEHGAVDG
jgi:DNA-binding CsgD family transcriptional regulator